MPNNNGPVFKRGQLVQFEFAWEDKDEDVQVPVKAKGQVVARSASTDRNKTQEYYFYDVELESIKDASGDNVIAHRVEEEILMVPLPSDNEN